MTDTVSRAKLAAIQHFGAEVIKVTPAEWVQIVVEDHSYKDLKGQFIHPILAEGVMTGHGTMGLIPLGPTPRCGKTIHVNNFVAYG